MSSRVPVLIALVVLLTASGGALAAERAYLPGIEIALEVRTPQGDFRSFQRPGSPPTYWTSDLPVVKGDQLTIVPLITTGGAELGQVRVRLDNAPLAARGAPPWRVRVDTSALDVGYHLVEVWAATKGRNSRESSATATFLLVPRNDPLLSALSGELGEERLPVSDEERLACVIRSRDPKTDEEITTTSTAVVAAPTLFFVSAGPAAKEFFYTLSRDGQATYTSPRLPMLTHILLEPKGQEQAPPQREPAARGQEPGKLILTARAGDGEGRFGPPNWVTVRIESERAAESGKQEAVK